jgi:hypothetical protein
MEDLRETMGREPVTWDLVMHFDVRGAEDPGSAERSREVFLDASRLMKKIAATRTVTLCIIWRANVPPRVEG